MRRNASTPALINFNNHSKLLPHKKPILKFNAIQIPSKANRFIHAKHTRASETRARIKARARAKRLRDNYNRNYNHCDYYYYRYYYLLARRHIQKASLPKHNQQYNPRDYFDEQRATPPGPNWVYPRAQLYNIMAGTRVKYSLRLCVEFAGCVCMS